MKDLQVLFYTLPAIVVALLSYFCFKIYFSNEEKRRQIRLISKLKREKITVRFRAYERLTLFLERMAFTRLLSRVSDKGEGSKKDYSKALILTIEKEFDYNLSQQIYMTADCWKVIKSAQKSTIDIICRVVNESSIRTVEEFKTKLIALSIDKEMPYEIALNYLKKEVRGIS